MVVFERHNFVFNFFDYQWRRAGLMGPASERAASIPFSFWDFYFSFFFFGGDGKKDRWTRP